ncbi:MAG: DNA alkylation repair protein [Candidatus Marinimicrobia bacterium]|nr:DNA alkylation repair protein [Candidatus Neomarinimicrobiota bacterium]
MTAKILTTVLQSIGDPKKAEHSYRFFKSFPGGYGEGDKFLGIKVPDLRAKAKEYKNLALPEVGKLLRSEWHEARLLALFILVGQFKRKKPDLKAEIYRLYLDHLPYVNNWDLVDSSAHYIMGVWLLDKDRKILYNLANSAKIWKRRIGIMSTFHFIRQRQFDDALAISKILLHDTEDLIHKAVGWMLREIGNRDGVTERDFLKSRYQTMPRTMLRYAIEKFPAAERQSYLQGTI